MEYRELGNTGLKISTICLGTMNFNNPVSETDSITMIHWAIDKGINFIDLENNSMIKTDPRQIKSIYKKTFFDFCNRYRLECRKNNIDYVQVNTSNSLDKSLIEYLIKRSKIT